VSEEQQMPEYKQGENVRLTVELRDQNGVGQVNAWVALQGSSSDDPHRELHLTRWPEGHPRTEHHPMRAEVVLTNEVDQQPPGVCEGRVIVAENAYHALSRHELDPPLRLRIVDTRTTFDRGRKSYASGRSGSSSKPYSPECV
jgi:hypothetical protein